MRAIAAAVVVAVMVMAAAVMPGSQARPDFSGAWVASTEAAGGLPAAPGPVLGARLWLRHAGDRLTVVRSVRDATVAATFPLDGSEVRTRVPGGVCQGDAESIDTAAWDGPAIAFTTIGSVPPGGGTPLKAGVRRVLRLPSADTLVIEGSMRESVQAPPRRVATVYKRSSDPVPALDQPAATRARATLAQVAWISGTWRGTAGSATVEERWTPAEGGAMLATARTLRGTAMTAFEFLCIAERNGGLVYSAMPNARTPATDFTLTAITADSATFENPTHDFPKRIRYARTPDGSLETSISGGPGQPAESVVLRRK